MTVDIKEQQKNSGDYISRFEIVTKLGSGGMGIVYKAFDPLLNKTVGLKVLNTLGLSPERQVRFQQEAKALKDLRHPAIPEIYNFAISEEEEPYIVMEYVEGKSLKHWIDENRTAGLAEIRKILMQTCNALSYAHAHGIVHRDIKPDNIIVSKSESDEISIKLIDFGLAKLEEDLCQNQDMTQTGQILGSPPYMSPEQIRGQITSPQSDIYSIGCVLYELLAGQPPFIGDTPLDTISKHLAEPIDLCLKKIPEQYKNTVVQEIIEKCIQKNKEDRFDSTQELMAKLEEIELPEEKEAKALLNLELPKKDENPTNLDPVILLLIGFGIVSIIALTSFYNSINKQEEKSPPIKQTVEIGTGRNLDKSKWKYTPSKGYGHWYADHGTNDSDFKLLNSKSIFSAISSIESDTISGIGLGELNEQKKLKVTSISISSRGLTNEAISNASLFPNLNQLYLEQSTKITAKPFAKLKGLKKLQRLGFKGSVVNPGTIENISQLVQIESLSLRGSKPISVADMKLISKMSNLHTLIIDGTGIPLQSLSQIAKLAKLQRLSVESLKITDKEVKDLSRLKLHLLDLSDNPITQKSLSYLKKNKNLKIIGLIHCTKIPKHVKEEFKHQMAKQNCEVHLDTTYNPFNSENYPLLD